MEEKDYRDLLDGHSRLFDWRLAYKEELRDFIEKSFELHGDSFEYKCKTHPSWTALRKDADACFCAEEDLPMYISVLDAKACSQDFHPTRIRLKRFDDGKRIVMADGFNWTEDKWQKNRKILESVRNLEAVADFIKEVLEQELPGK